MSLRLKLFIGFLSLIIIPLLLLVVAAYEFISSTIEQKYSNQAELTLKALRQSTDFVFREMDRVTDSTIASTAIQDILRRPSTQNEDLTNIDYINLNLLQRNFQDLLINHPSVRFALMYKMNDNGVIRIYSKEYFQTLDFQTFKSHPVYKAVLERDGLPKWIGPYEYPELTGNEQVFTQYRVIKDINTLKNKGVLLVQMKNTGIESVFSEFWNSEQKQNTRFYLVNQQGMILFDNTYENQGQNIYKFMDKDIKLGDEYQSVKRKFGDKESVISSIGIGRENWHLVSVASWDSLSREVRTNGIWLASIALICLLAAFMFVLLFLNRIIISITRIVRLMRRVESGEMWARVDAKGKGELFLLSRGFNSLMDRITDLFEQVKQEQQQLKKSEMQLLQAQIRPHFLFNTLESINALAVQNQGKKVSQMVQRLGNILRIGIQGKEEITVREEVEHLSSYLEIQKYRFEDLFDYAIDVPEYLLDNGILKLTLQPLVENSIQHGFEGIDYKGIVAIAVEEMKDKVVIEIRDNGVGIPNEVLAGFKYNRGPEEKVVEESSNMERRGLGVCNVADRLRIHYGKGYGLFICSEAGNGTTIRCMIPKKSPGDQNGSKGVIG